MNGVDTKKLNSKTIIMISLMIAVIGISIFIVYDKVSNKKSNQKTLENETIELSLDDELVRKLYKIVTFSDSLCHSLVYNDTNMYFYKQSIKFDAIPDMAKYIMAGHLLTSEDVKLVEPFQTSSEKKEYSLEIKREKMDKIMQKIFGNSIEYSEEVSAEINFDDTLVIISYDQETDSFKSINTIIDTCENIEDVPTGINKKMMSAKRVKDFIVITENVLFDDYKIIDEDKINYSIYTDYYKNNKIVSKSGTNKEEFDKDINNNLKKGLAITYRFKLSNDGNYYFYDSTVK